METCPSSHFPERGEETSPCPQCRQHCLQAGGSAARAGTWPQPSPMPGRAHGRGAGRAWGRCPSSGAVGWGSEPVPGGPARHPGSSVSLTRCLCSAGPSSPPCAELGVSVMLPWALSLSGGYKNPARGCRTCHLPGHQCLTPGKRWSLGQLPHAHGWALGASSCGNSWRSIQDPGLDLSLALGAVVGGWGSRGRGCPWLWQVLMLSVGTQPPLQCSRLSTALPAPTASTGALAQGAASGRRSFPGHGQGCLPGPGAHWARCPLLHMALMAALAGQGESQSSSSAPAWSNRLIVTHTAHEGGQQGLLRSFSSGQL